MKSQCRSILLAAVALLLLAPSQGAAQFDTPNRSFHDATNFPLEGKHLTVACESCHVNGQFEATPNTCFSCHWQRRRDDPYQTSLGTQCEQCHRPISWTAVRWDHGGQAGVPLNIDHRVLDCRSCHTAVTFSVPTVTCIACHQQDFNATREPNHLAAGFPATCDSCHRPGDTTWQNGGGAGFSHQAVFPLQGVHATLACATCHVNNVYQGTARECVGCHQAEYNRTADPSHAAAGFPTTCESCHRATDASWDQGTFVHSWFPLRGPHNRPCAQCHTTPGNVMQFSCTTCHARGETDGHHREVNGYRYESTACYACHPNGRE